MEKGGNLLPVYSHDSRRLSVGSMYLLYSFFSGRKLLHGHFCAGGGGGGLGGKGSKQHRIHAVFKK